MSLPLARPLPQHGAGPETTHHLPLLWFGAAFAWLAVASLGLLAISPDLAVVHPFAPRTLAVTHAFTIGLLVSAVFGALHQFVPAVMGVPIRRWRVARAGFWFTQAGAVLLVAGLWAVRPAWQGFAWLLLFLGVGLASWNTIPARRKAVQNREVGAFVSLGHSALGLAMVVALARIGHGLGWWAVGREALVAVHFHLGVVGFGGLTVVGIGSRMLPAFFQAPAPTPQRLRLIGWLISLGLFVYGVAALAGWKAVGTVGAAALAAGMVLHLHVLIRHIRQSRVRPFDPALGLVSAAVYLCAAGLAVGLVLLAGWFVEPTPPTWLRLWVAYGVLAIAGWLVLVVLGVMHRIIPRLLTLLLVRHGRRPPPVAMTGGLPSPAIGWGTVFCLGTGVAALAAGVLQAWPGLAGFGAMLYAVGVLLAAIQGLLLVRRLSDRS